MKEGLFTRYQKALEGLTVGGSEYYNDPERCAKYIKEKIDTQDKLIKKLIIERRKIFSIPIIGWLIKKII